MSQPILVPLDGSKLAEQALPYAQKLAEPGCQLILLRSQAKDNPLAGTARRLMRQPGNRCR